MTFLDELMQSAASDVDVLRSLASRGDDFTRFRDVDFLVLAPSKEKAEAICGFINDYRYGRANTQESDDGHQVLVIINMPVTQSVITCVAGFMACIAHLFGGSLDGWGCPVERQT